MRQLVRFRDALRRFVTGYDGGRPEMICWNALAGRDTLFHRGLQDAIANCESDEAIAIIDECWEVFTTQRATGQSSAAEWQLGKYFWRPPSSESRVDTGRVYRNALALLATARAALALCRALIASDSKERFAKACLEAAAALDVAVEPSELHYILDDRRVWAIDLPADSVFGRAEALMNHLLSVVSDRVSPALRSIAVWVFFWLGNNAAPECSLLIPIVGYEVGNGFIAYLNLRAYDCFIPEGRREGNRGTPSLIEQPETALQALDEETLETIQNAFRRLYAGPTGTTSWGIRTSVLRAADQPLGGRSLSASISVGFKLLCEHGIYDSGCLLAAEVAPNSHLLPVGYERAKLNAILVSGSALSGQGTLPRIRRVGLASDSDLSPTEVMQWRNSGVEVHFLQDLDDAAAFVSGLSTGLAAYYQKLIDHPDSRDLPAYLGGHKPTELYVWPDVLKKEKKKASQPTSNMHGSREHLSAESLDIGEESGYDSLEADEVECRVPWRGEDWITGEIDQIRRGNTASRWCVVLGPPGQGKTELVEMTVAHLAAETLGDLREQRRATDDLMLPVRMRCAELARATIPPSSTSDEWLRNLIRETLKVEAIRECSEFLPVVLDYLIAHIHESRTWLFLDALDEVEAQDMKFLNQYLAQLRKWNCIVVVTSRPYGYKGWHDVAEYRLAPFTSEQARSLVSKWYRDPADPARHRLEELLSRF